MLKGRELPEDLEEESGDQLGRLFRKPAVSYTHLRAHETVLDLVCRLLLEKTNNIKYLPLFIT
mgnify:CR=1 FL=1